MPPSHADSNLLFGIIALQMDFISRDALIDAMHAWTLDKQKHLGEILTEHGDLSLDRRSLLDELVQEHLRRHDNDAAKSLGAISADSSIREVLESIDDPQIHEALTYASDQEQAAEQLGDTYATQAAPATTGLDQRFRVLRPHAQGGLGQVSVALDKELDREVALKELQMRFSASEASRERFMVEAAVTGGLEHPGIVPVYGLGHYSDGRPYYAMRFIRGDNLKEAIERFRGTAGDRGNHELRKLLRRFIDVCDAIQYAHSRGVLHRDLKPGNIMLGKYGETLVVDWGLAKPVDSDEVPTIADGPPLQVSSGSGSPGTSMGSVVGTPGYMSPEQAAGRLDLLGPASDVYGLGATLYHLLTGEPPFKQKISEMLMKVERGEFKKPRDIRADVPAGLEAICLQAMATRPEDRYSSAFALAEDIEHWLADERVGAWQEPVTVRISRWVRKHTTLVTSVAAAACAALVVVGVSFFMLQAAYQREQTSHARARQVVDDYFTQVSESTLLNQPGMQELRRDLLERAAHHYQTLAEERGASVQLREELGKSHFRLGIIKEAIESHEAALAELDLAAKIQRGLVAVSPQSDGLHYDLGLTLNARGRVLHREGNFDDAIDAHRESLEFREHLVMLQPADVEYARTLANTHMNLGEALREQDKLDEAEKELRRAVALREPLIKADSQNKRLMRDVAKGRYNLANLQADRGQHEESERLLEAAVQELNAVRKVTSGDLEIAELTAQAHRRLGDLQQAREAYAIADLSYASATRIISTLNYQNPSSRSYLETHAAINMNRAPVLYELSRANEAIALYKLATVEFNELAQAYPNHKPYREEALAAVTNLGRLLLLEERPVEAADSLTAAFNSIEQEQGGISSRTLQIHGQLMFHLARCHWSVGDPTLSAKMFDLAIEKYVPDKDSKDFRLLVLREKLALSVATAAQHSNDSEQRVEWQQAIDAMREQIRGLQGDEEQPTHLAESLQGAARLQWAAKKLQLASITMRHACDQWKQVADESLVDRQDAATGDLAALLLDVAAQEQEAAPNKAKATLEHARDLLTPLVERHPDDEYYRRDLRTAKDRLSQQPSDH